MAAIGNFEGGDNQHGGNNLLQDDLNEDINAKLERMLGDSSQPQLSPEYEKEPKHRVLMPKFSVMKARNFSPNNSHAS